MSGRIGRNSATQAQPERVMLVGVMLDKEGTGSSAARLSGFQTALAEAVELVKAAGGDPVLVETAKRDRPHTALFVGTGKVEELAVDVAANGIDLVVFNHELTPTQERNLEKELKCRVLDRVGLILAIFARRARTQEGRLQVELAQLSHLAGRLIRGYGHLQSQRGGIGMKGPGETKLETDRRLIAHRINALKRQLANLKKQRALRRKPRKLGGIKTFALVGYTNVGKSTLFNCLTKAGAYAQDQLFATLDTTARRLYINPECSIILTDTVGFVSDLPYKLISAFSATLEETAQADVLLHVVDASAPGKEQQIEDVENVLREIKADRIPCIRVYNKTDLLPSEDRNTGIQRDGRGRIAAVYLSAEKKTGINALRDAVAEYCAAMPTTDDETETP
ncbi:GTPase HflX [Neisseria cinerea]|uniref:GTPase HflX n=1 Tax=Neisseria cinerea TaxID=483 RepID=UPI00288A232E|nr:GTPase HflX [Neisseria cinerea]